jgi:Sulfotransferase family
MSPTADTIVQQARDLAGLERFDSESFREGLAIAAEGISGNRYRTPEGEAILQHMFVNNLATRLRLADYVHRNPRVRDEVIERPVFIMGMPRTGTTLVSYLLGADTRLRSLLRWEVADPVPPPTTATLKTDPRCLAMIEEDKSSDNPFSHIHYEAPDGPTECTFVMAHEFKSLLVESLAAWPSYSRWMLETDLTSAYDYHHLYLQVLQSQAPGTWSLKLPSHALGIRVLMNMYPDARIIWTHRDPFRVTGSLMSMIGNVQAITCSDRDLARLVSTYPHQLSEHVRRPMAVQDELGKDPFYHIHYSELVRDPLGQMRKLYVWLGDDFTETTASAMQAWLANNPQGKFGSHSYTLDEFGLSKNQLMPHFEEYLGRFDIEMEEVANGA